MARQLKEQEMRVLRFIYDYIKSNDYAPTRKEIAEAFDIPIRGTYDRVLNLFGFGCLRESEAGGYGRNIALTKKGILACGHRD